MIRREALGDQTMVSSDRSTGRICMNSDIIKVIAIDRMVWFQGKQLALALGFKDPIKSLQTHVDDSDRQLLECHLVLVTATETRLQWVSECGFYSLVYGSTLPSAKAFKAWVIREVLPSIRRTGELLDTEHSLVKAYDRRPVLYIGDVGHPASAGIAAGQSHDGIALVKIGCSDTIREMVRKLKTEFGGFILQRVFSASNNRQIKKLLKVHPVLKSHWLSATIKGKKQTELMALSNSFKLTCIESPCGDVAKATTVIHRVIEANPPLILEQLRQIMQTSDTDVDRYAATQVLGSANDYDYYNSLRNPKQLPDRFKGTFSDNPKQPATPCLCPLSVL